MSHFNKNFNSFINQKQQFLHQPEQNQFHNNQIHHIKILINFPLPLWIFVILIII